MSIEKAKLFKTARARISCASFKAGDYVSVSFYWQDGNGEIWFAINRSEHGPCVETAYPAKHLTDFCL